MRLTEITDIGAPELRVYADLTERQLRNVKNPSEALFIAESPKVIGVALDRGLRPESILCERRHLTGDAAPLLSRCPEAQVYTADRPTLSRLTGYALTRGVLAAFRRPQLPSAEDICKDAHRVCVIDSVVDSTNIGAIFRSAAALGIDAIAVTRTSCDPLNRRAVRVSMGSVFLVPWTWIDSPAQLKDAGFKTVAMALTDRSVPIDDEALCAQQRLAIIMGTEGDGLAHSVIADADYTARIPMHHNVDSLNVAAAAAVAFWQLRYRAAMKR